MNFSGPVAIEAVLRCASAFRFVREEPRNSNRGQAVETFIRFTRLDPPQPWCASYVAWVGAAMLGDGWPLPLTASCYQLHQAAKGKGLLREAPAAGDVFLTWSTGLNRMAHTGFVVTVLPDGACRTTEGNTNGGGSRDGWGVFERTRRFGAHDRFIRWVEAL